MHIMHAYSRNMSEADKDPEENGKYYCISSKPPFLCISFQFHLHVTCLSFFFLKRVYASSLPRRFWVRFHVARPRVQQQHNTYILHLHCPSLAMSLTLNLHTPISSAFFLPSLLPSSIPFSFLVFSLFPFPSFLFLLILSPYCVLPFPYPSPPLLQTHPPLSPCPRAPNPFPCPSLGLWGLQDRVSMSYLVTLKICFIMGH